MKKCIITLALMYLSVYTYCQNGFYSKDGSQKIYENIMDGGDIDNARMCQFTKDGVLVKYSPHDINFYVLNDGRKFYARKVQLSDSVQRVFLEQLTNNGLILYYYAGVNEKLFFIQKDSTNFIKLPKYSTGGIKFTEKLLFLTSDCGKVAKSVRFASYNKRSLTRVFESYNKCEYVLFDDIKYGILAGYNLLKIKPSTFTSNPDYKLLNSVYDGSYLIGVFIDKPIYLSDFSLYTQIAYSKHGYSINNYEHNLEQDLVVNVSSLSIPLQLKYTFTYFKISPFLKAGLMLNYNFENSNVYYETNRTFNEVTLVQIDNSNSVSNHYLGWNLGAGIEFPIYKKKQLFVDFQYYKLRRKEFINFTGLTLNTGIIF